MFTIADAARATEPRKRGRAAFNANGDRLVRRISGPTALPIGATVIEATGDYMRRTTAGWQFISAKGERLVPGTDDDAVPTLDLKYPLVQVDLAATHDPRPNRAARRAEAAEDRRTERSARRFKSRRVREFLAACSPAERAKYAAALGQKNQAAR